MPRPDASREKLLDAAARLLASEGPSAVSTRRLAMEVGVSTMVVYTRFGSMRELMNAVVDEGFDRLAAAIEAIPATGDPVADLRRLVSAYCGRALEDPHLYVVMYGIGSPDEGAADDAPDRRDRSAKIVDRFADAARRAMEMHTIRTGDPAVLAHQLWCAVHGFVMLEVGGFFAGAEPGLTLEPFVDALLAGSGAESRQA